MKTVKFKLDPDNPPAMSEEAKRRLDSIRDEDIDFSDIPDMSDREWVRVEPHKAIAKPTVTMRLDEAVIAHFKAEDPKGYTARMASVLRAYVEAQRATAKAAAK